MQLSLGALVDSLNTRLNTPKLCSPMHSTMLISFSVQLRLGALVDSFTRLTTLEWHGRLGSSPSP